MIRQFQRLLAPLARRVDNMVARAVVKVVRDTTTLQSIQLEVLKNETRDNVERFQEYGFTSVPKPGAEAVVVFAGGDRSHGLIVAIDDRRYRLRGLEEGEVAIYTDEGDRVHIKRGGVIEVVAGDTIYASATSVVIDADSVTLGAPTVTCTGALNVQGATTLSGSLAANGGAEVTGMLTNNGINVGSTHTHPGVTTGPGSTGTPQ